MGLSLSKLQFLIQKIVKERFLSTRDLPPTIPILFRLMSRKEKEKEQRIETGVLLRYLGEIMRMLSLPTLVE